MTKRKIVLVDDNQANLTACKKAMKDQYDVYPCPSAEKMFEVLTHIIPDLILLDVEMPAINGYEAMRMIKKHDSYKDIPVIFLSAMDDAKSEMEGLNLGAVDYIHKPFVSDLLIRRIETHMAVIESKNELSALNKSIEKLLAMKDNESELPAEVKEEAIKELLTKSEYISRMGRDITAPLNTVIEMIETAINESDIEKIKGYLIKADTETRLILEIVNDMFDLSSSNV